MPNAKQTHQKWSPIFCYDTNEERLCLFPTYHFHLEESGVQSPYQANFAMLFGRFKCHTYGLNHNVYYRDYMHGK